MTHQKPSPTRQYIKGFLPCLLLFLILLPLGVGPVVSDDPSPWWDPYPRIGCDTSDNDVVDEIIVPTNNSCYYLYQLTSFSCNRAVDRDRRIVGGSTSFITDAMATSGYPEWSSSDGSFPNGYIGTSVNWRAPNYPAVVQIAVAEDDVPSPIPPNELGSRGDNDRFVDTRTVYSVGVDTLTWNDEGQWVVTYEEDPLYVLKDTPVQFRAFKTPYQASNWPSGKPVWGGSAGASGTGETKTVTFSTKSNSLTDYKTVTVECGNVKTVKVVVYTLEGILWPDSQFAGRSQTDYGIEETVSLGYSTNPSAVGTDIGLPLEWIKTSGVGYVPPSAWWYDAKEVDGNVTLKLRLTSGPSKGLGPLYSRTVWKPCSPYMTRPHPTIVRHTQWFASAGIELWYWLNPSNVSFSNLRFKEGSCSPTNVTGYFECCEPMQSQVYPNGAIIRDHPAWADPGHAIITVDYHGSLMDGEPDHAWTGEANPYAYGHFTWPIPTLYQDEASSNWHEVESGTIDQTASFKNAGAATITKDSAASGSAALNDPTVPDD